MFMKFHRPVFFLYLSLFFSFLIVKTKRRTLSQQHDLEYNSFLLVEHFLHGTCDQIFIYDECVIESNIIFFNILNERFYQSHKQQALSYFILNEVAQLRFSSSVLNAIKS